MKRNIELWKSIEGFPGYSVSCFGRVYSSLKFRTGIILKPSIDGHGYQKVDLCSGNGKSERKGQWIHLLVITHFGLPKPTLLHQCNHKDGNKLNNWWSNLEWMTAQENVKHAHKLGLASSAFGERHGRSPLLNCDIIEIRLLRKQKMTLKALADKWGVSAQSIHAIVSRKTWGHL